MSVHDANRRLSVFLRIPLLCSLIFLTTACSLVPKQEVLPYSDHVAAGLKKGDQVEIVLHDGHKISMTISEITVNSISSEDERVFLSDIASLSRQSWRATANPCDDGGPRGCSIPILISVLSEFHAEYGSQFRNPCTKHDFCYEHGLLTYSYSREDCDEQFLGNMQSYCTNEYKLDLVTRSECMFAADQMHAAVRLYGEQYYAGVTGQYCEYAGPPFLVLSK